MTPMTPDYARSLLAVAERASAGSSTYADALRAYIAACDDARILRVKATALLHVLDEHEDATDDTRASHYHHDHEDAVYEAKGALRSHLSDINS